MKTVDKYQFNEQQGKFDSGIECFLAYHTVIKKYFTLKRICSSEDADQALYNYLIKEVSILKKISHDNVYRCYKMLKTKNNLYLIYDNVEGETLERVLKEKLAFQTKLSIVKQIGSVLIELRKNNLAHLALNPNNIILQPENKIKVINFGQAQQFQPNNHSISLTESFKSSLTIYLPPEVYQSKAHVSSDVYSFGMIIVKIFESEFERRQRQTRKKSESQEASQGKWIARLSELANKMTIKIPEVRITIQEFESTMNSKFELDEISLTNKSYKSSKSQNVITSTPSRRPHIAKNVSQVSSKIDVNDTNQREKSVNSNRSGLSFKDKRVTPEKIVMNDKLNELQAIIKKILKKRNFVVLLLKMADACTVNKQAKTSTRIILSYLFIKKAAIAISQLAKLLKFGKNAQISIQKRIQEVFFKSKFFSIINPLVNKQMISTQQMLQRVSAQVGQLDSFTSNSLLMEEMKHQKMNNSYLRNCVFQFLNSLSLEGSTQCCQNYELNEVIGIYLISLLSSFKTYEQAHEALFSEAGHTFEEDPLIKSLLQLKKQTLFQLMEFDLQLNENKDSDTISLAKSARVNK